MADYPLWLEQRQVGELHTRTEGLFQRWEAKCYPPRPTVYRIWLVGEQGELLLGVPEPEGGGCFSMQRRISCREVERIGRLQRGELRPQETAEGSWSPWAGQGGAFAARLRGQSGVLCRPWRDGWEIAMPFSTQRPLLLPELFCLLRLQTMAGGHYAVLRLDGEGNPCL